MTIRNDATRLTLRPRDRRAHRATVFRQGQVLLDADLAHQGRLALARLETGDADMLGSPGRLVVPAEGFAVSLAGGTPEIAIGHGYLGGWLLENPAIATPLTQPHPFAAAPPGLPAALVLKALVRHVDPVEEPAWADPGLGDAQAGGREINDWHVFPLAAPGLGCATILGSEIWAALTAPSSGTLRVAPVPVALATDPCSLVPQGGFSRGENLLYRIEVHGGVALSGPPDLRFGLAGLRVKLSRRNASVLARIVSVSGVEVVVTPPALDPLNWFAAGLFAEVVSPQDDLAPQDPAAGERLFRIARATDTTVTLEPAAAALLAALPAGGWFLRLWDTFPDPAASGTITIDTTADPAISQDIDIGDGLQIRLGGGAGATFRRGDYWTFAARADGGIDWPPGAEEPPHGPEIRFAPLAMVTQGAAGPEVEDCRIPLATLTDRALLYRGGDGQEIFWAGGAAHLALPAALRVAVMRGRVPVLGARVLWRPVDPGATLLVDGAACTRAAPVETQTTSEGLCAVIWSIATAATDGIQQIEACLLDAAGAPAPQPIIFSAGFRTAAGTSYFPGACTLLAKETTVQGALDTLCANIGGAAPETLSLRRIALRSGGGEIELLTDGLILNGLQDLPHDAFIDGIEVRVDSPELLCQPRPFDPILELEIDLPYPTGDFDRRYWSQASGEKIHGSFGFQRLRLDGTLELDKDDGKFGSGLIWWPSQQAQIFLSMLPEHLAGQRPFSGPEWKPLHDSLLCRLRLRAAQIWGRLPKAEGIGWLNAEHLGTRKKVTDRELMLEERDPQRAADLDMFFYIKIPG